MDDNKTKSVALIVAHPDDETLWAGGTILSHPAWTFFIVCLSRKSDTDRAPKFYQALKVLKSEGIMGDLDDGPYQEPLDETVVEDVIMELLPKKHFDLIISHNPSGEYTRHLRHEEVSKAVIKLWNTGKIAAGKLWIFAYEDGNKEYFPRAVESASSFRVLSKRIWTRKYNIISAIYGYAKNSWESETTPKAEAFWQFTDPLEAKKWRSQSLNLKYEPGHKVQLG